MNLTISPQSATNVTMSVGSDVHINHDSHIRISEKNAAGVFVKLYENYVSAANVKLHVSHTDWQVENFGLLPLNVVLELEAAAPSALPAGAATEAKQDAGNVLLTSIENLLGPVAQDATVQQVVTALNDVATGTKQTEQKAVLLDILSKATDSDAKLADVISWLSALNDELQTNTSNTAAISGNTADIMNHIQSLDAKADDLAKDATLKSESDESQLKQDEGNILLTSIEDLINQLKNNAEAQYALLNAEHTPTEYNVVNSTDTFPKNPQCRQLSILAVGDGCKSNGFLKKEGFGHTFASSGTLPIDSIELTADAASEWIIFEYNTAI